MDGPDRRPTGHRSSKQSHLLYRHHASLPKFRRRGRQRPWYSVSSLRRSVLLRDPPLTQVLPIAVAGE